MSQRISRRRLMSCGLSASLGSLLARQVAGVRGLAAEPSSPAAPRPNALRADRPAAPSRAEAAPERAHALVDDLARRAFNWFQKYQHPGTGLVLDRGPNRANAPLDADAPAMASVSAAGFFLSLLPAWEARGWLTPGAAADTAAKLLRQTLERVEHHQGILYHFVDWRSGQRWRNSEVATLDTAIFLNGAMVAAAAYGGAVAELAAQLLDRAAWPAFVIENPRARKPQLAMGWSPERGYFGPADVRTSEMAMPYFLAAGSRQAIAAELWYHTRVERGRVAGREILHPELPLFTANYGLAWHPLAGRADREGIDLDANAREAALANRAFCRQLAAKYPAYADANGGWWGLSAGDGPHGYVAVGPVERDVDGTAWPLAALAALPWIGDELQADLMQWSTSPLWPRVLGDYGLAPLQLAGGAEWIGPDLIGIDLGSFAAGVENARDRGVWRYWMQHPIAERALGQLGFRPAK